MAFKYRVLVIDNAEWYEGHSPLVLRDFVMIIEGVAPSPCPIVAPGLVPLPVYVTTLNPAVAFTDTVLVMEPAVFVEDEPAPASHCHAM